MSTTTSTCALEELAMLETARKETLALTAKVTQAQADFVPAPGRWSVGQNMDHLVRIHLMYEAQIRATIEMAERGERPVRILGLEDIDVGLKFVPKAFLPLLAVPIGFFNLFVPPSVREAFLRTPYLPASNPPEAEPRVRPLEDIRADLASVMRGTREYFDRRAGLNFYEMRLLHPMFGDNTVPGLLRICGAHEQRHHKQIAVVMADARFA